MSKYTIGIDYGTLSARALVVDVETGRELASATMDYAHGVMDRALPDGTPLKPDWALQHPGDYVECLRFIVPEALRRAGVSSEDVIGLGVDCTASTVMPVDEAYQPLCLKDAFSSNPYAWTMLWKHHAAQEYAARMQQIAEARGEDFLPRYGAKISSEWMLPKLWQIVEEAPEVYDAAYRFIEAADWIVLKLTGCEARSSSIVGYKAFWNKATGYPSGDFLRALNPKLENLVADKLNEQVFIPGTRAGVMTQEGAALVSLKPGTPVAVAAPDAHVSLPAAGVAEPGKMLMIMGTSTCHIMLGESDQIVPGICGSVEDGVVPGLYAYEAGQSCCGDHFKWLTENCIPASYMNEAEARGMDIHSLLTEKAEQLRPGQSGLIALDWWNGNRSVLVDWDLTGTLLGMTLTTRPEEIYRALIEATAYGTRVIVENFEAHGVPTGELCACGGIARKNPMMMQIYADVLKRDIRIARSSQTPALGSAILGAVAAGRESGGYDSIVEAAAKMGGADDRVYRPIPENSAVYDELFSEYMTLHDYFGRGGNDVMKRLKRLRERQLNV